MNIIKDSRYGPIIFPNKDKYIGKSFDLYGEFSYQEVEFLKELVEPGDVVIDVGANIGGITIPLAQKIGPEGYMVAFEPQQYIYYMLCGNIAVNDLTNTACFQRLVSDVSGQVLNVPVFDFEKEGNFGDNGGSEKEDGLPVSTCTLDSLNLSKPKLIKIDVQGNQFKVLKGAIETIRRSKPFIYVEAESREESDEIVDFLEPLGYNFLFHRPPLYNPDNFYGNKENVFDTIGEDKILNLIVSGNIFAYPKEDDKWDEKKTCNFFSDKYESFMDENAGK